MTALMGAAHQQGMSKKLNVGLLALGLLLAAIVTVGPAVPAQAACGDVAFSKTYSGAIVGGFRMAISSQKQNVGCVDGNVRQSSSGTNHRGQWWRSSTSSWVFDSQGIVFVASGTHSPVKVLLDGPFPVGTPMRIGTANTGGVNTGIWWF